MMKRLRKITAGLIVVQLTISSCVQKPNINNNEKTNKMMKTEIKQEKTSTVDNSKKSVLARGCDPELSLRFSKVVPPHIGNAEYIPTTNDIDFIKKLKSRKWSVVYFAPGACRYNAASQPIPGGNIDTKGWTLEQYKDLIIELQGDDIKIVESIYEEGAIELLNNALLKARNTK